MKECKVLMLGTDPDGQGGIATVVSVLRQQGFFERQKVRYIVTHANGTGVRKALIALKAVVALSWLCLTRRSVIVHVHSASRASFFRKSLLLAIARLCGRKTVFHLHGGEFRQFLLEESGPLVRWWIRHTIARSSVFIALSDSWADFLHTQVPSANVRVIANSVVLPADVNPVLEESARILFLGRASKGKGIFDLLAAVARLKEEFPEVMLVIGGDGDLQEVERVAAALQVSAHITLLGWIGQEERDSQLR
ncbi:MAG: glycosyltransferase family 4 protein, partial [Janthinobacterium lividum]|nr:glycosyltransferase family 4 protein [Janthinobacterium lividum]